MCADENWLPEALDERVRVYKLMSDIYEQQLLGIRWDPAFYQLATTEGQRETAALPSALFCGLPCANFVRSAQF
jgi:hypothetical protein